MLRTSHAISAMLLLGTGFLAGLFCAADTDHIQAQESQSMEIGNDVLSAYRVVKKSSQDLESLLVSGSELKNVTTGVNFFSLSVGGIDAEQDLEDGRGVDPETFAKLYADLASPKILEHLDYDELGRLRYKKNVIRLYSRERLKTLFRKRDELMVRSETAN